MVNERRKIFRREADHGLELERDDLFLLLESYRNTIELNTTLLERQAALTDGIDKTMQAICKVVDGQANLAEKINAHRAAAAKEHNALTLRVYAAFSVIGGLAVALIGLLIRIWPIVTYTLNGRPPGP